MVKEGDYVSIPKINIKKRKEMEQLVYNVMDTLDPSNKNSKLYKNIFAGMSDAKFESFMRSMFEDDNMNFFLQIKEFDHEVDIDKIKDAADVLGVPLMEYPIYPHLNMDQQHPIVPKTPRIIGYHIDKRMQQMNLKKNSTSINVDERSSTTGQVTGHDRNGRNSDQENSALRLLGAEAILKELNGFRADGIERKNFAYAQIAKNGSCDLEEIEQAGGIEDRLALNTLDMYYLAMGLKTDLVSPDYLLPLTLKQDNNDSK